MRLTKQIIIALHELQELRFLQVLAMKPYVETTVGPTEKIVLVVEGRSLQQRPEIGGSLGLSSWEPSQS